MLRNSFLSLILLFFLPEVYGQGIDSFLISKKVQEKYFDQVKKRSAHINKNLSSKTEKYILRLKSLENNLRKKLNKIDPVLAHSLFANSNKLYEDLLFQFRNTTDAFNKVTLEKYVPHLDKVQTSLKFIEENRTNWETSSHQITQKLRAANDTLQEVRQALVKAEDIRDVLKRRRQYLFSQLSKLGFSSELKKINNEVYYYAQQIKEYKDLLNQPRGIEQKVVSILQKIPAFQEFMQDHSELSQLFPVPQNLGTPQVLQGLQTKEELQQLLQSKIGSGPNAHQIIQENIQIAQTQLNQLKDKINQLGGMSSDGEIPDFKPNTQKAKSFLKRLEYSTTLQTTRSNYFFPVTTDFELSVGYKLNDRGVIGIGSSYKLGWGRNIRQLTITHEGVGLRSFIDWKLKGNFYISGGYEQNYRVRFHNVDQLRTTPQNWQSSGLIGLSKKYSIGKKWKGNLKLLFDFLYQQHVPATQPVLFRFGYTL